MSYDLYFSSSKPLSVDAIKAWFGRRKHYQWSDDSAHYENPVSGVYFTFEVKSPEEAYFNINFCRPHVFGLEAVDEVEAFVQEFGWSIDDPQSDGMGEGPFTREGFLRGWNSGNAFGCRSVLSYNPGAASLSLPELTNRRVWQWNRAREAYQDLIGSVEMMTCFVPTIYLLADSATPQKVQTAVIWGEAMEYTLPEVDLVLSVPKSGDAPRVIPYATVAPLLNGIRRDENYQFSLEKRSWATGMPHTVLEEVTGELRRTLLETGESRKFTRVRTDEVFDRELVG